MKQEYYLFEVLIYKYTSREDIQKYAVSYQLLDPIMPRYHYYNSLSKYSNYFDGE